MLKQCAFVLAIAACGGSKAAPKDPLVKPDKNGGTASGLSECAALAAHVADVVFTFKEPPPTTKDVVAQVVKARCEGDGWSADARKCFAAMHDEESAKPCIGTLTEAQHKSVMNEMESHFDRKEDKRGEGAPPVAPSVEAVPPPASAPPPAQPKPARAVAPPKAPAKSPAPKKGSDPCEGGE